jgi:hypothetical protein
MKKRVTFSLFLSIAGMSFAQIPTSGLIAAYSFNSGNADDEIGDNNGVINGGVSLTEDRFGNPDMAYELDGVDGNIDFGDSSEFQMGTSDFALSFWYYYDSVQLGQVIGKRGSFNNYEQYAYVVRSSSATLPGTTSMGFLRTGGVDRVLSMGDLTGAWHHVVLNHDYDSGSSIYIDGVLEASSTATFSDQLNVLGSSFNVGFFNYQGGYYFEGKIDDIYFYNRFLDSTEIAALYNAENPTLAVTENEETFTIFPNPASDKVTVRFKQPSSLSIYSLDGKCIASVPNEQEKHTINCIDYPAGVYLIKAGNQTQRFVVE